MPWIPRQIPAPPTRPEHLSRPTSFAGTEKICCGFTVTLVAALTRRSGLWRLRADQQGRRIRWASSATSSAKEILGLGDARNEMICFFLRHRADVSGNEPQEECRGSGRN